MSAHRNAVTIVASATKALKSKTYKSGEFSQIVRYRRLIYRHRPAELLFFFPRFETIFLFGNAQLRNDFSIRLRFPTVDSNEDDFLDQSPPKYWINYVSQHLDDNSLLIADDVFYVENRNL